MLDWLAKIWCVLVQLPTILADLIAGLVNGFISGLAAVAQGALNLLPDIPDAPDLPAAVTNALGYVNWALPVGPILTAFTAIVTVLLVFFGVRILLRWVKAD